MRSAGREIALGLLIVLLLAGVTRAADAEFPYGQELLLDAAPMKGVKRMPSIEVEQNGRATIGLWCNDVAAQFVVAGDTLTVLAGAKSDKQCDPERTRADDLMLSAFTQVTNWHKQGDTLVLEGAQSLRFRPATN
jgi:heat shock protein HslJ